MTGIEDLLAKSKVHSQAEPAERIANALELIALEASAIRVMVRRQMKATEQIARELAMELERVEDDDE